MLDYIIGSSYVVLIGLIVGDFANASFWSEFSMARAAIWKEYKLKGPDFGEKKHLAYAAILRHQGAIMIAMSVTNFMRTFGSGGTILLATVLLLNQLGPIQVHTAMMAHQLLSLVFGFLYLGVINNYVAVKMEEQGNDVIAESAANLHRELGRIPTVAEIMAETIEVFRTDLVWEVIQASKPFYLQLHTFWLVRMTRIVYLIYVAWLLWPLVRNV
jgi:hypothetical protein